MCSRSVWAWLALREWNAGVDTFQGEFDMRIPVDRVCFEVEVWPC